VRIAFASDLHLEFNPAVTLTGISKADILVLAGDVDIHSSRVSSLVRRLRLMFSGPILYVLGNHEYYGGVFQERLLEYREAVLDLENVYLLERDVFRIGDVRFLGTTLWTDFAGLKHADSCRSGMADFRLIRAKDGSLSPDMLYREHLLSRDWLESELAHPFNGKTVVVTHHAPSFLSQHPRFAGSSIGGGFCSNLNDFVERWKPSVWIHGHLHDPVDYRIGETRVLCNPWGYQQERLTRKFCILEL
jgi:Icc-related predicted phosphoesterase